MLCIQTGTLNTKVFKYAHHLLQFISPAVKAKTTLTNYMQFASIKRDRTVVQGTIKLKVIYKSEKLDICNSKMIIKFNRKGRRHFAFLF